MYSYLKEYQTQLIYSTTIYSQKIKLNYQKFILIQASYGIAQRGGVKYPTAQTTHIPRLVSDINILTSQENKHLIFSETIFSN
jgi:hypothetical protein